MALSLGASTVMPPIRGASSPSGASSKATATGLSSERAPWTGLSSTDAPPFTTEARASGSATVPPTGAALAAAAGSARATVASTCVLPLFAAANWRSASVTAPLPSTSQAAGASWRSSASMMAVASSSSTTCPIELCMEAWAAGSSDPGAQDRAFLMENATGDGRSYLVRNLVCGGAYYGCFELVDVNAPFQPADFALVDYFGNLLSLVMPHQGRPQPTEEPLGPLRDLLDGRPVRPQVLGYALSKAGWRPDDPYFVARFGAAEPAEDAGARGQTVRLVAEVYPRARFFDDGDAALMVARDADYPLAALRARHAAHDVEKGAEPRFRAGFSSLFADFSLVRTAADQAALAYGLVDDAEAGGAFGSTLSCFYDDCWFEDVRLRLDLDADAAWLLDHAAVALARADAEDGAAYVETALAYLGNGCNASRTAEALFIHRNTLAYRLKRIKALSGIDLENPAAAGTDLLRVHLSCRLLAQGRR